MRIELFKGSGLQPWYLRAVARNGKTLVVSEGYLTKFNAKRAARKTFPGVPLIDLTKAVADGSHEAASPTEGMRSSGS